MIPLGITWKDNTLEVQTKLKDLAQNTLDECAGEMTSQVKRNTKVKTGKTKNSWRYVVTEEDENFVAVIGSDYENAIWEEFGTGEYAKETGHSGREGGWVYEDEEGKWHRTIGKKARRPFHKAYTALKNKIIQHIQDKFKGAF